MKQIVELFEKIGYVANLSNNGNYELLKDGELKFTLTTWKSVYILITSQEEGVDILFERVEKDEEGNCLNFFYYQFQVGQLVYN